MSGLRTPIFSVPNRLDELDAAIGSMQSSQQQRADTSLSLAKQTPAPAARSAAAVAKAYGIDPSSVPAQLMAPDAHADLIRNDQPLSSWLSNPTNAAQVHDDLASMTSASWLLQRQPTTVMPPSGFRKTITAYQASWRQNTEVNDARVDQVMFGASPEENARLNALSESLSRQQEQTSGAISGFDAFASGLTGVAKLGADVVRNAVVTAPSMVRGFRDAGAGVAIGAAIGGGAASFLGPEAIVPGAVEGAKIGGIVAGTVSAMWTEAGAHMDQLMRARTAHDNAIDETSARLQSIGVGVVNGVLETLGEVLFLGSQKGLRQLLPSSLIPAAVRGSVASAAERAVGQRTGRAALGGLLKSMGARVGEETLTEGLQSIAPGLSNISLNVANDRGEAYGFGDVAGDVVDSGVQAFEATLLLGLPFSMANYAGNHMRAAKAQATSEYFTALSETMRESKAVKEAPETVADMIRTSAPNAPTVYVPAEKWATFFQAAGVQPEVAAQEILGDAGEYITATQTQGGTGGYLAIPMDVYATKLAAGDFHTAVAGDIKINLNDLSANEAKEQAKILSDPAAVAQMLDEMRAALPVEAEGEAAVRADIVSQLQNAGMTPEQAAPLAELHGLVYRSLAQRSEQSVDALASQRQVTILGGRDAQRALNPSVALDPDKLPSNLTRLSASDFEAALARVASLRDQDMADAMLIPESVIESVNETGNTGTGRMTEDMVGAIEAAGYTVEEWNAAKATMAKAQFRLRAREASMARLMAEQARRDGGGVVPLTSSDLANGPDVYADSQAPVDDFIGADGQPLFQVGAPVDGHTLFQSAPQTITVDGVERSRTNSNGQPIAATDAAIKNFWKWFGDSKVVDEQGRPIVVYHGTTGNFDTFDASRRGANTNAESARAGFFFTDDAQTAASYANFAATDGRIAALVAQAMTAERRGDWEAFDAKVAEYEALDASFSDPQNRLAGQNVVPSYLAIPRALVVDAHGENAMGFDIVVAISKAVRSKQNGVIIQNLDDAAGLSNREATHYIVFAPTQIKSAIGNTGTFDPQNPSILYQDASAGKNGYIQFRDGGKKVLIGLLNLKNPSTFIHESAHLFVEMVLDTATRDTASEQLKADAATIRAWLGAESGPLNEAQHETFARAFESYWETAKAPSPELASLFTKFRVWITSVYKSIGGLKVPISAEVRAVFDRMIAGEDAVAAAQQDAAAGRFTSAEQGQMTPEQFAVYQQHGAITAEAFAAKLQAKLREETVRESRQAWKDEIAQRTAEMTAALQESPVYQAWEALKGDDKLPRQWVEDFYGPDARKQLTQRKLTAKEGGVDPSVFALEHGFANESEMIGALLQVEPLAKVVALQVADDMQRAHGSLLNDSAAMAAAVQEAMHDAAGDPFAQLLAEEFVALGRALGIEAPAKLVKNIQTLSRDIVSRVALKDLRPHGYLVAERKAAREFDTALAAGKRSEAYAAKRRQLLNHVLYAEAVQAQTDAREARAALLTYTKTATRQKIGKIGQAWLEQIDGLLERVDLKQRTKSQAEAVQHFIAFLQQKQEEGDPLAQSLGIINAIPGVPYQLLTVQQMRDLRDAVTTLGAGARNEGKAQALAKGATQEGIRAELLADIEKTGRLAKRLGDPMSPAAQKARSRGRTLGSLRTLPSLLREFGGGNETSAWWRYLLRTLNEASTREVQLLREGGATMERVDAILTKEDRKHMERESFTLASGQKLTVREMLAVALNTGTEGNQQRLRDGNQVTDSEVQRIREQLSDTQLQWVQGVWDMLDAYWPETEALAKRLDGVAPEKVEAVPFVVRGKQYRGGYYRIKYDPTRSGSTAMIEAIAEGKDYSAGAAFRGQTKHGSRIERLEKVSSPLRLDLRVIDEHLNEVAHDLTHAEILRDMGGVLRDRDFVTAMQQTVGADQFYQVQETYRDLVRNGRPLGSGSALAEKFTRHVSAFSIAFNFSSAVINLTNYTSSVQRVGAPWVLRAIYQTSKSPLETRAMVLEKSQFMQQRATHATRNAGEEIQKTFETEGLSPYLRVVQSYGHHFMHFTQQIVDIPTWLGAYQKATAQELDDATAVQVADQAIIDSQGSNATKDLALVMRERGGQKVFTAMFSYMSMQYNLIAVENRLALQKGTRVEQTAAITMNLMLGIMLPAVLGKIVRDGMKGENPFDEELPEWAKEIAAYTLSLAPGLREISGYFQGFDYSGPAGARLAGASTKAVQQISKAVENGEITSATLRATNTVAGLYFGYPGVQLDRTIRGIGALLDGRTNNPLSPITGPPRSNR